MNKRTLEEIWKDWNETERKTKMKKEEIWFELYEHEKSDMRDLIMETVEKETVIDEMTLLIDSLGTISQKELDKILGDER